MMEELEKIRAERRAVNAQIEALRAQAIALSDLIRDIEGPIPDRTGRNTRVGYRIVTP